MSSMAVPLAPAEEGKRGGREGRRWRWKVSITTLRHIEMGEKHERGKRGENEKRGEGKREAYLQLWKLVCDLW